MWQGGKGDACMSQSKYVEREGLAKVYDIWHQEVQLSGYLTPHSALRDYGTLVMYSPILHTKSIHQH